MCYGDPAELLAQIIDGRALTTNVVGHTVLDDFEHFCFYSGCDPGNAWGEARFRQCTAAGSSR
ncbi:hypothetical protein [Caballeronia sp. GaOx3]|uniref:hypothetical protein n=1 Tax=Caballeronia sp. GaOx3 TaxID=2921740 RepID=UPI0020297503|nr:hypothetical protein [Caballeronia sp. GaOx3]